MTQPDALTGGVYRYPRYYAIGYQWNTEAECDFLEACLAKHVGPEPAAVLDIGCGAGRHLLELARRGHRVTGFDLRPEMVEFVNAEARNAEEDAKQFKYYPVISLTVGYRFDLF